MKKKILFVPSWFPNPEDPIAGVFIEEQAVALSKEHDVAVLLPRFLTMLHTVIRASVSLMECARDALVLPEAPRQRIHPRAQQLDLRAQRVAVRDGHRRLTG